MNEKSTMGISYLYENDFEDYQHLFAKHCPPPLCMPKGSLVYEKGVSTGWMYYVSSGMVKLFTSNYYGVERVLAFLKEGNIIGLDCFDSGNTAMISAQCVTDVWCTPFTRETLRQMMKESPDFAFNLTTYYAKVTRHLYFDAENQSISDLAIRLANFLFLYSTNSNSDIVEMTQQELASAMSCSRSSISRICDRFRQEGILRNYGKGLSIMDMKKLYEYCRF